MAAFHTANSKLHIHQPLDLPPQYEGSATISIRAPFIQVARQQLTIPMEVMVSSCIPSATSTQQCLFNLYKTAICESRTLVTGRNSYQSLLKLSLNKGVFAAILYASAAYGPELIPSLQLDDYTERKYLGAAVKALLGLVGTSHLSNSQIEIAITIAKLLMHRSIVDGDEKWVMHVSLLGALQKSQRSIEYESAMFPIYQIVLAESFCKLQPEAHQGIDLKCLKACQDPQDILDLGLSRELLYLIGSTTKYASEQDIHLRQAAGEEIDAQIREVKQRCTMPNNAVFDAERVIHDTADCYRLGARVLAKCRLQGHTTQHPEVQALCKETLILYLSLPDQGHLKTAQHPLWPAYIAALGCIGWQRADLYKKMARISCSEKGNVKPALHLFDLIWLWQDSHTMSSTTIHGWVERMLQEINPSHLSMG